MKTPKSLRKPTNWQDFESLCKKLWGEIWNCPEIKKNGRTGQNQQGVDIYGIPKGETQHYGIQCKGKDEYTHKQLTEKEINSEIKNAKEFKPKLKKLYFATTAVKDAKIEEFIRIKNEENIQNSLFEVHLYSWEDIVELIDDNTNILNWYNGYPKTNQSVNISFQNDLNEITITPKFKQTVICKRTESQTIYSPFADSIKNNFLLNVANFAVADISFLKSKINLSFCELYFKILNTGIDPIEEYKLSFEILDKTIELVETNKKDAIPSLMGYSYNSNLTLDKKNKTIKVNPKTSILVGNDIYCSDKFYLKPLPQKYEISLKWNLVSKNFQNEGNLQIHVMPEIIKNHIEILVEDSKDIKTEKGEIEEYIIEE